MFKTLSHYYDGSLYRILVDPVFRGIRESLLQIIPAGSTVIDIACGTGALVFSLAPKVNKVLGVEMSEKMIEFARKKNIYNNVEFRLVDASSMPFVADQSFDYATICMAFHEMPEIVRNKVLAEAKRVAKNIIIVDYSVPVPRKFRTVIFKLSEFLAGREHYSGYKNFIINGGIDYLLEQNNLKAKSRQKIVGKMIEIVETERV